MYPKSIAHSPSNPSKEGKGHRKSKSLYREQQLGHSRVINDSIDANAFLAVSEESENHLQD